MEICAHRLNEVIQINQIIELMKLEFTLKNKNSWAKSQMLLILIPNCNRGIALTICLPPCLIFVKRDNVENQPIRRCILQSKSFANGDRDNISYCEGRGIVLCLCQRTDKLKLL